MLLFTKFKKLVALLLGHIRFPESPSNSAKIMRCSNFDSSETTEARYFCFCPKKFKIYRV